LSQNILVSQRAGFPFWAKSRLAKPSGISAL
jgi:hypothetical protein